MGDVGEDFRALRGHNKDLRRLHGVECPQCKVHLANSLLDEEGENQAVRCFLRFYGQPGLTVDQMKRNMRLSGYPFWPEWVDTTLGHLTKAGAQLWLRHLFALENGNA